MYHIIIADDENITRESIVEFFDWNTMGFEVVAQFEDGSDAIAYLESRETDLVISDVCMYEVSGLELAQYVSEHCPRTKMVMLSGFREFDYARQAMQYGAKDYLLKPIDKEELCATLARIRAELDEERRMAPRPPMSAELPATRAGLVKLVKDYIDAHLAEELTVERLARYVSYSESHFSHEFRAATGASVMEYVTAQRMVRAKELLQGLNLTNREVARSVGYADDRYFLRVFQKHAGMSVRAFRQRSAFLKELSNEHE